PANPDALREMGQLLGSGDSAQMRELIATLDTGTLVSGAGNMNASETGDVERSLRQIDAFLGNLPEQDRNIARDQMQALTALIRGAEPEVP
ncbi:hypothetical protein GY652_27025, partial [Escherichia coli]